MNVVFHLSISQGMAGAEGLANVSNIDRTTTFSCTWIASPRAALTVQYYFVRLYFAPSPGN